MVSLRHDFALTMTDRKIWRDGHFIDWEDATVHVLAQSLPRGSLAFDYISVHGARRGTAIFRLRDHIERLATTCRIVGQPLAYPVDELVDACVATVQRGLRRHCAARRARQPHGGTDSRRPKAALPTEPPAPGRTWNRRGRACPVPARPTGAIDNPRATTTRPLGRAVAPARFVPGRVIPGLARRCRGGIVGGC